MSNFTISFMLCITAIYSTLLSTHKITYILFVAFLLLAANFIYEWYLPIFNTPDKIDAYYGFTGTLLPFLFLIFYKRYGRTVNPNYENTKK